MTDELEWDRNEYVVRVEPWVLDMFQLHAEIVARSPFLHMDDQEDA